MEENDILIEKLQDIKQQKDTLLTPENIRKGVQIFDIEGAMEEIENLNEELTAQDEIIAEQQTQIATLINAMDGKTAGGGGEPNIFMQLEEPSKKAGIWFKVDDKFEHIETADKVASDEFTWNVSKANIPYGFYQGSAVLVGTDIYLLGGFKKNTCYKYSTLIDSYTQMTDIPYEFYFGSAVLVGTDIYLFGGDNTNCYKYDTLTDSYTKMANIPNNFRYGSAVSIGTDIYLFGGYYSASICYKYNTLTNSYTKMTDIPYGFYQGSAVSIGTDIYLLGGYNYQTYCYKYDTLTNNYTKMTNIPYNFFGGSVASIGTDIYLFGSNNSSITKTNCYKYNTLTNNYTQMTNIPYNFYFGSAVLAGTNIYLLGGEGNSTKVQVMEFPVIEFSDKTVLIQNGTGLKTELMPNNIINGLKNEFKDTYYYTTEGNLNLAIPVYIGNGTEWTKIRGGAE